MSALLPKAEPIAPEAELRTALDALKADYTTASSEQQKALICRQAWALVKKEKGTRMECRYWLAQEFPALGNYQHELRQVLLKNPNAAALWDRIDGPEKMLVTTAYSLARKAIKRGLSVVEVLAEYDAAPWVQQADGTKFRRVSKNRHSKVAPAPPVLDSWTEFHLFGKKLVEEQLKGEDISGVGQNILWKKVDVIMAQALAEVKFEVRKSRAQAKFGQLRTDVVTRSVLIDACNALVITPPKLGQPVDLKEARHQKRVRARTYHPDSNDGVVDMPGFERTIWAYDTLVKYNKQLQGDMQ